MLLYIRRKCATVLRDEIHNSYYIRKICCMEWRNVYLFAEDSWPLGSDWCDVWHSLDVLASTASILNLALISLDRFWAVTDPFAYQRRMTSGRALLFIALVWLCSAAISFPAIAWWRIVTPPPEPGKCLFTDDSLYLVLSSVISFYVPVAIILFAYYRIYVTAVRQIRCLRVGSKVMVTHGGGRRGETLTLRVHRGRYMPAPRACSSLTDDEESTPARRLRYQDSCDDSEQVVPLETPSRRPLWKTQSVGERLGRLSREHRAAKTLGVVMGVFCVCWVPFFVCK